MHQKTCQVNQISILYWFFYRVFTTFLLFSWPTQRIMINNHMFWLHLPPNIWIVIHTQENIDWKFSFPNPKWNSNEVESKDGR